MLTSFDSYDIISNRVFERKDKMENQPKPIWQSNIFVILTLVIFWPVGMFLMWKYTSWRNWTKGLLTAFFLIGAIPILFIWSLLFGLKSYSFINNLVNPRVVNQSKLYNCVSLNSEWGRCTNIKYNFSFDYPVQWNYIDLRPEGIGFSPSNENLQDNYIISLGSPSDWENEDKARQFAKGYFGVSQRQETTINGLYAAKDYKTIFDGELSLTAVIVDGKTTYQFMSHFYKLKEKGVSLTNEELQLIFDRMANSFEIGR